MIAHSNKLLRKNLSVDCFNHKYTRAAATTTSSQKHDPLKGDYQLLQKSKLPTMYFQASLPRLPIPLVEKTCEKFLAAVQPIVNSAEFHDAEKKVQQFRSGVGMELQALLKNSDNANKATSYISAPWFDMYLSDRAPLPLNYNPLLVMNNESRPEYKCQIVRATNLVVSSLRFWRSLQNNLLEPEIYHMNPKKTDTESFRNWMRVAPKFVATYAAYAFKAFPLDMSQYEHLFGVTRVPETDKDRLVSSRNSNHILVMRRGNLYAVDVLDANGKIEQPSTILGRLRRVLEIDEKVGASAAPLGVLTTSERNTWADVRKHLESSSTHNKELFETGVDSALFCLCLDGPEDPVYNEANPIPLWKHLLAGDGTNRWFDKSVSLLVSHDGTAALNFEHSWGDGVAVLRYFNEIYKDTTECPRVSSDTIPSSLAGDGNGVRSLDFHIDDESCNSIQLASAANAKRMNELDMNMCRYPNLSKLSCKQFKVSPDAMMQLSFQLAYRKAFNSYVGSYESCSTAAFRHGRTETIRPCTIATTEFCEAMMKSSANRPDAAHLRSLIDKCSAYHGELTKNAAMGQGFDRHLFALKDMAIKNNMEIPDVYFTEAYKKINHNIISTSTLSSPAVLAGAFGPVVRDGLGIGYSIQNNECGAIVTSYEPSKGKTFIEHLSEAFDDINKVLSQQTKSK